MMSVSRTETLMPVSRAKFIRRVEFVEICFAVLHSCFLLMFRLWGRLVVSSRYITTMTWRWRFVGLRGLITPRQSPRSHLLMGQPLEVPPEVFISRVHSTHEFMSLGGPFCMNFIPLMNSFYPWVPSIHGFIPHSGSLNSGVCSTHEFMSLGGHSR